MSAHAAVAASTQSVLQAGFARHQSGDFDQAERLYQSVLNDNADDLNALHLLGLLLHQRGRHADAVAMLQQAAAVLQRGGEETAQHAALYNNLGNALQAVGRGADAVAQYRHGLELDPSLAELHNNLGNTLIAQGDVIGAIASYEAGRRLGPLPTRSLYNLAAGYALSSRFPEAQSVYREAMTRSVPDPGKGTREEIDALVTLACILIDKGQCGYAVETCRRLVESAPNNQKAHYLFGRALAGHGQDRDAAFAFRRCLEIDPQHIEAMYNLGVVLAKVGLKETAVPFLEIAISLQPNHVKAHVELGNLLQKLGNTEGAFACFRRAGELRPLVTWPAEKRPADFSILLIASPGAGNTPPDFLFGNPRTDRHFFALLPDVAPDLDLLRSRGDVVVNLISDVDQSRRVLLAAVDLFDQLDKPIINHPRKILNTDRDAVARRLSGIPLCRVPRTVRCTRGDLVSGDAMVFLGRRAIKSPLLLRPTGTHGGDAFEKIETSQDVAVFLRQNNGEDLYATEYLDYQSPDGHFRKYRFIFTNNEILPYHLAIGNQWKVHHYTTDMAKHSWMQREEQAFLEDPGAMFSQYHYDALRAVQSALDLEFFGIDCSLDRDGNIVVFEVNACMLIHDDNADFPYKTPHCNRIRDAFETMLERVAKQVNAGA